jgi:hypothetical protein
MTPPPTSQVAFGLQYQPASAKLPTFGQGEVLDKLWRAGVEYIRLQWIDYTNVARNRTSSERLWRLGSPVPANTCTPLT